MTETVQTGYPIGGSGIADLRDGAGMEILCASDERYLPHTATMLYSLLEHNRVFRIHLFYDFKRNKRCPNLKSFCRKI